MLKSAKMPGPYPDLQYPPIATVASRIAYSSTLSRVVPGWGSQPSGSGPKGRSVRNSSPRWVVLRSRSWVGVARFRLIPLFPPSTSRRAENSRVSWQTPHGPNPPLPGNPMLPPPQPRQGHEILFCCVNFRGKLPIQLGQCPHLPPGCPARKLEGLIASAWTRSSLPVQKRSFGVLPGLCQSCAQLNDPVNNLSQ